MCTEELTLKNIDYKMGDSIANKLKKVNEFESLTLILLYMIENK